MHHARSFAGIGPLSGAWGAAVASHSGSTEHAAATGQPAAASAHGGTAATSQGAAHSLQRNGHHSKEGSAAKAASTNANGANGRVHRLDVMGSVLAGSPACVFGRRKKS